MNCTPNSLKAAQPKLGVMSETENLAVAVQVLADTLGLSANQIINESACFACMSEKDMLQALVTKLVADLGSGVVPAIPALQNLPQKPLMAAIVYGLCKCTITKT